MRISAFASALTLAAALSFLPGAAHAQTPAAPSAPAPAAAPAAPAGPPPDGPVSPHLAQSCYGCHGPAAQGQNGTPAIAGYDRAAFVQTWAQFRANERPATIMNRIARGYSNAEVAALADYFAKLK